MAEHTITDEAPEALATVRTAAPLSDHESEAVRHLASAIGGLTTTVRAVASGRQLHEPHTLEPLGWTGESLSEYDRLARASRAQERRQKAGRNIDQTAEANIVREAVCRLSSVAEAVSQALEVLALGAPVSAADTLRFVIMADGQLTEFVRMIPEDEYTGAIRQVWGRDAMPVRLR
ncbi:hypothetical protein [Mesorhizobium sp.]|uniref:hypothetical protein n=1 Tax=Mesorhizobium sp. TaxID=1871066 RepID=UPI000FE83933|nr:hypothetical protein [Mesorhizobium sp.]RWO88906.1 MAG: hypothetical protein EOQ96_07490 [Mesorhizobium sp.]